MVTTNQQPYLNGTATIDALGIGLTSVSYGEIVGLDSGSANPLLSSIYLASSQVTSFSAPSLAVIVASATSTLSSSTVASFTFPALKAILGAWNVATSFCAALTTISMPVLQYWQGSLTTTGSVCPIATLNFPALKAIQGSLTIASSVAITSIDFTALQYISGTYTQATSTAGLTTIPLPAIVSIGQLTVTSSAVTGAITLSNLKYLYTSSTNSITTGSITSLSLPALAYCNNLTLSSLTSLTTISLPALVAHGAFTFSSGNGNIATVTMGTIGTLKRVIAASTINLSGQKMTSATVNAILALYASLDGTNGTTAWASGTINVSGGTNGAPTGQGITDKATCQARGLTVTTN